FLIRPPHCCLYIATVSFIFFFNASASTGIYTLSLHDALPISGADRRRAGDRPGGRLGACPGGARPASVREPAALRDRPAPCAPRDRKSTRLNSSHVSISYAVFCLKKKKKEKKNKQSTG